MNTDLEIITKLDSFFLLNSKQYLGMSSFAREVPDKNRTRPGLVSHLLEMEISSLELGKVLAI